MMIDATWPLPRKVGRQATGRRSFSYMPKSMLIDASHPEETRVVVVNDRQLEEFDFESSTKRQLKGNIYLAKVTRVEPSLQAAFVDYGGDRHGFLAFSEIHPDYYQIPQADRHLLEEASKAEPEPAESDAIGEDEEGENGESETVAVTTDADEETEEVFAEQAKRRQRLLRNYKIQEVIKRRQIILVQVVKEERGNKGAALTTYLSLAGRYCVLMPNTARGGGISRKIANVKDRTRLKTIARELDVPEGMGLIVRTAGQSRNKLEIRRDYDYLLRLWSDIRDRTLDSIAPCTIHEEGALIKRAIRDIYDSDIGEILVEGEEGYKSAKKVMTMLMPSRARRVKQYKEELPLFHHFHIEPQLDALHSPVVELKSGGSIVINPTEALTAIDVNSGRSTRERNIEETAHRTNSEAAEEIARQLRLRDVAGLVVIDFIDMIEMRNQRIVERRLRDALRFDRARIQLGRISTFGLLELSRQRLRPSFLELSTQPCPVCAGSGTIRSVESAALQALRAVEIQGMKGDHQTLSVTLALPVALYLLNQKRHLVVSLEQRYGMAVDVQVGHDLIAGQLKIETIGAETADADAEEEPAPARRRQAARSNEPAGEAAAVTAKATPPEGAGADPAAAEDESQRKRRRRRRRRRRSGSDVDASANPQEISAAEPTNDESSDGPNAPDAGDAPQVKREPSAEDDVEAKQSATAGGDDDELQSGGRRRRRGSTRGRRRGTSSRGSGRSQQPSATNGAAEQPPVPGAGLSAADDGGPSHDHDRAGTKPRPQEARPDPAEPMLPATIAIEPNEVPSSPAMASAGAEEHASVKEERFDTPPVREDVIADTEQAEPRRGWWNRFVRKQD